MTVDVAKRHACHAKCRGAPGNLLAAQSCRSIIKHFPRLSSQLSNFVASKSTFSYEFSHEPQNLLPQNRCFVRGVHQISSHLTKCNACHNAIRKRRNRTRLKCCALATNDDAGLQPAAPATKNATHLLKTMQKYYTPATPKKSSTRYETCWNVTKFHACHAKRG